MKHVVIDAGAHDGLIERPGGFELNGVFIPLDLDAIDAEAEAAIAAGEVYDHDEVFEWIFAYIRERKRYHAEHLLSGHQESFVCDHFGSCRAAWQAATPVTRSP